ncbi:lipid II:glycine glycyltransferase FemX [Nesterenkonia sp. CL21]|uniref:lipid II:glycine glycyltransferase FemX n=1 Tax=unclassified Nesterenkonia TaxID=2629769 RepID=UPI0028782505|nr:peptidoglycan bridge formation glycyltransferase FemA/FemB family protein [Nesterenkonia sp. CL21]MDS2172857.1 peptidoglycan bridge formation glycyltransferase FemA/FemB family protein [Nesterenkonia sp. CL21]
MSTPPQPSRQTTSPRRLSVTPISTADHATFLRRHPTSSFLQNPRWPQVKTDWRGESLGAFDGDRLVAATLVLHRRLPVPAAVPVLGRKSLAYLAEGPVFDPDEVELRALLPALTDHLKRQGAFLIRMGLPGVTRRWAAQDVRRALASGEHRSITELEPLTVHDGADAVRAELERLGWQAPSASEEFEAGQPQFQARIPLTDDDGAALDVDAVLARMDQTSRRQTRKSTRSELTISTGGEEDLPAWQALYEETAERDDFTGRPLSYFQRMFRELNAAEDTECTLYFAHHEETLLAAAIYVRQGQFAWYVYGASSSEERKRYAPRALQLRQIEDALAAGCRWYDLGGLSPSLDPEYPLAGLTRFKTTMGADVVQTYGEWDFPVDRLLTKAFTLYMSRR